MDRDQVRRWEAQCIEEQAPACAATCPLHVDARKLAEHVSRGDFKAGFAALAVATPLAPILAFICDHPCQRACRRAEVGDAVQIGALERACATFGGPAPALRPLPSRNTRVAVIGGGLSGVSAALSLAQRGHGVTLFELKPRLLARVRDALPVAPPDALLEQNLALLESLGVHVKCNALISRHEGPFGIDAIFAGFEAIYLATGPELFDETALGLERTADGRLRIDSLTLATSNPRIFAGGAQRYFAGAYSPIASIADGSFAAVSIDRALQGASLDANRDNQGPYTSRLYVQIKDIASSSVIKPADGCSYTRKEAVQEAGRCIPCHCLECVKVCQYLEDYGSYPKRYVRQIYNNECIVMGVRNGNRMINSCALCGLCVTVCPENLSMANVCLDARQTMVRRGKMPPSTHEFALRDMAFSQSDAFTLARHAPGTVSSAYAFLPGCQLSASSPDHVATCYNYLRSSKPGGVGLILECCGAPARWAGDEDKFHEALTRIESAWQALGKPRLISACSSCYKTLADHLPQIPVEPLWKHLTGAAAQQRVGAASRPYAIHDPCSTRGIAAVEESARELIAQMGIELEELNSPGLTTCCGYGGLQMFANPALTAKTVARRAAENPADYITYCAMCRDRFAHEGKRSIHLLDLVFPSDGTDLAARPDPGFSTRQENRARLKQRMLRDVWHEKGEFVEPAIHLSISDDVRHLLERRMILLEDIRLTIAHAEHTGERFEDPVTGRSLASLRSTCVTYWVEYARDGERFIIYNAYSHRMEMR